VPAPATRHIGPTMRKLSEKTVLLFFEDHVTDRWVRGDRHLKRLARRAYHTFTRRQKVTGFQVWYQLLVRALRDAGYDVRTNDYRLARRHPEHPVGVTGYPHIMDGWSLPNPAVLGPGLFDHPKVAPGLMEDPRYRSYIVTCDWMKRMFEPYYGDRCVSWHAGIDLAEWPDTRPLKKPVDVLIYDKIRWERDRYEPGLLEPVRRHLESRGLKVEYVRYKFYDHATYRDLLRRSRSMLFLCEHETQGMAYQEALASNVPVLAWDNGFWQDPERLRYEAGPVPVTSVPYFSEECGERFGDIGEFEEVFERFWSRLDSYEPRAYVARELSFAGSAELYMKCYTEAAR
jgi:hypothetical protein